MRKNLSRFFLALLFPAIVMAGDKAVSIYPEKFDFGWCPDNAKVTAEFSVKNNTQDLVPLTQVMPSCGCTAADFTPANVATDKESKITLTFNTRGFGKTGFTKSAKVIAGNPEQEYTVLLSGFVSDPSARVFPTEDGIFNFSKDSEKTMEVTNKSDEEVTLKEVQAPSDWLKLDLSDTKLAPGKTITISGKASGSLDEDRNTSVTYEAVGSSNTYRFTIAAFTGEAPEATRIRVKPAAPSKKTVAPINVPKPTTIKELK